MYSLSSYLQYFLSIKASGSCREHLPIKGRVCWGGSFKHRQRRMCKKTPSQSFTRVLFQSRGQGHRLLRKHNIFASYQKRQYNDFMWRTRTSRDFFFFFKNCNNNILNNCLCIYSCTEKWELFRITRISVLISHTKWLIIILFHNYTLLSVNCCTFHDFIEHRVLT